MQRQNLWTKKPVASIYLVASKEERDFDTFSLPEIAAFLHQLNDRDDQC